MQKQHALSQKRPSLRSFITGPATVDKYSGISPASFNKMPEVNTISSQSVFLAVLALFSAALVYVISPVGDVFMAVWTMFI